jgi:hypothetical protein
MRIFLKIFIFGFYIVDGKTKYFEADIVVKEF